MEIIINQLGKKYGNKVVLDNITMRIGPGVFGLLGENGAGKSTLMRILATILQETNGNVTINGISSREVKKIRDIIGYLPQDFTTYSHMTVTESLEYFAILSRIPKDIRKHRVPTLLEELNLKDKSREKVKNLSGGMLRRLGIAQALVNDPEILIVDEPTAGLDPQERIRIRNLLCEKARERIIILSTHIVEDIEMTCSQLAILNTGKILYSGNVDQLIENTKGKVFLVEVEKDFVNEIKTKYKIIQVQYEGSLAFCRILSESFPNISQCKAIRPTLEDAYMQMLGGEGC